jgi:hypothetical protein
MNRVRIAALVGLAMVAALLAGTGPSSGDVSATVAGTDRSGPRTLMYWSGYRIERTGKAAGGFIGARRWGRHGPILYRIDPTAATGATTYQKARWVSRLRGPGKRFGADRRATARAAWIVSKYGTFRYDVQSAAVDAALLHLLASDRWRLNGDHGTRRIRQSGEPAQVRSFARTMLDNSRRLSGPYAIQVQQTNVAVVGDPVGLGIRVTVARNGQPLPFVPVRVSSPAGSLNLGTTDEEGWVRVTYEHPSAGATPLQVSVAKAPETRLKIRTPSGRPLRSRVVVAGRKSVVQGQGVVYVKARPEVEVLHGVKRVRAGGTTRGRFRLFRSAEAWPRRAVATLHGPYTHAENVRCGDRIWRDGRVRVTEAGYYRLPRFELRKEAFYVWRVQVPGNAVNLPAADCGGRFRVVGR